MPPRQGDSRWKRDKPHTHRRGAPEQVSAVGSKPPLACSPMTPHGSTAKGCSLTKPPPPTCCSSPCARAKPSSPPHPLPRPGPRPIPVPLGKPEHHHRRLRLQGAPVPLRGSLRLRARATQTGRPPRWPADRSCALQKPRWPTPHGVGGISVAGAWLPLFARKHRQQHQPGWACSRRPDHDEQL